MRQAQAAGARNPADVELVPFGPTCTEPSGLQVPTVGKWMTSPLVTVRHESVQRGLAGTTTSLGQVEETAPQLFDVEVSRRKPSPTLRDGSPLLQPVEANHVLVV